jgi:vanadium chloroperoxidase
MDQILYWNEVALDANRDVVTKLDDIRDDMALGPANSARALGIIHLAMHDAYFGFVDATRLYEGNPALYGTRDALCALSAHEGDLR